MAVSSGVDAAGLRARGEKLLTLDYFAALGVVRTASQADIQRAYVQAVKEWHPDRVPAGLEDLKPLFSRVFGHLGVARATLTDTARRVRYLEELTTPSLRPSTDDRSAAEAALEFKKAEALLKKNDVDQAEQHVRRAVQLAPTSVDYQTLLVWLRVKPTSSPADIEARVRELDALIGRSPTHERAFFYRAQLRKRLNLLPQAHADFARAAELNPGNIDAAREVRIFNMRSSRAEGKTSSPPKDGDESTPDGVAGFFRKLFKR